MARINRPIKKPKTMDKQDKIAITGTAGMVGSTLTRILKEQG